MVRPPVKRFVANKVVVPVPSCVRAILPLLLKSEITPLKVTVFEPETLMARAAMVASAAEMLPLKTSGPCAVPVFKLMFKMPFAPCVLPFTMGKLMIWLVNAPSFWMFGSPPPKS